MKRQIRRGVFETNSSSTHSLTMMLKKIMKDGREKIFYYIQVQGGAGMTKILHRKITICTQRKK